MTRRIAPSPGHSTSVATPLPIEMADLNAHQTVHVSGGCILPGEDSEDPLEHFEDIIEIFDEIYDAVSSWWD